MKKKLSKEDIKHLAKLSALQLSETEIEKITKQLDETLVYVENLKELETSVVNDETYSLSKRKNVFFDDGGKNKRGLTQEKATANGKKKNKGNFVVGRIL